MNDEIVKAFQQRLADLGWYNGPIDGVAGASTANAVAEFKKATALNPRKYVGVVTMQALFDDAAIRAKKPIPAPMQVGTTATWMGYAKSLEGTKEFAGAPSNPVLMQWAKELSLSAVYVNDGIAWCGLFVAHVMSTVVPKDELPKSPLGARSWLNYGVSCMPGYGAILVFWRGTKSGWAGHVGFYVGEDDNNFYVLGGNQSDTVNVTKVAKGRLLGARAPKSVPFTPVKVRMATSGKVSTNEA